MPRKLGNTEICYLQVLILLGCCLLEARLTVITALSLLRCVTNLSHELNLETLHFHVHPHDSVLPRITCGSNYSFWSLFGYISLQLGTNKARVFVPLFLANLINEWGGYLQDFYVHVVKPLQSCLACMRGSTVMLTHKTKQKLQNLAI